LGQKADEKQFNIEPNHRLNRPLLAHPKGCEMKIYIQITPEKIRAKITETFTFAGARKVYLIETTDELSDLDLRNKIY